MDLKRMPFPYWDKVSIIDFLQRRIIINSIAYYELDTPLWEDKEFDREAKQLEKLMNKYSKEAKQSMYWYCMHDFTAATGFDLYTRLNNHDKKYLMNITLHLLKDNGLLRRSRNADKKQRPKAKRD